MLTGLYSAATGISAAEQQQELIAQNLANINMPGYRRLSMAFATANSEFGEPGEDTVVGTHQSASVDFSPGLVQTTGRSLDVALDGDGFFAIDSPRGELFTRDGVMQINQQGQLVNNAGFPYQGVNPVPPNVPPSELNIGRDGSVSYQGQSLGQLRIVQFENNHDLAPAGLTSFSAPSGVTPGNADGVAVQQHTRELSNVNATDELVRMLIGMRYHEASQKAMNSLSDSLQEHISGDR